MRCLAWRRSCVGFYLVLGQIKIILLQIQNWKYFKGTSVIDSLLACCLLTSTKSYYFLALLKHKNTSPWLHQPINIPFTTSCRSSLFISYFFFACRTYLKLPWRPLICIDGSTIYELDDEFKVRNKNCFYGSNVHVWTSGA